MSTTTTLTSTTMRASLIDDLELWAREAAYDRHVEAEAERATARGATYEHVKSPGCCDHTCDVAAHDAGVAAHDLSDDDLIAWHLAGLTERSVARARREGAI